MLKKYVLLAGLWISAFAPVMAEGSDHAEKSHGESEDFQIGEMIMHHISDEHGWAFTHDAKLPLPVILYTKDRGLEVFSSARLEHGAIYQNYKNDHEHIVRVNSAGEPIADVHVLDFSITKNVAAMMLSALILFILLTTVAKGYIKNKGKAPKGIQSFIEPLILFLRDDVVKPAIGPKYERYFPYLLTLFFFIFANNILGLFPGGANLTGNIAITLVLAVITFLITNISANKGYWMHILRPPGVPWLLLPIMLPVEIVGVFMKPASLMIRLFANITAGHIIMLSLFGLIFIFQSWGVTPLVAVFALFMNVIEIIVAFLQAFIFTLLSSMYIGTAVEEHDTHH